MSQNLKWGSQTGTGIIMGLKDCLLVQREATWVKREVHVQAEGPGKKKEKQLLGIYGHWHKQNFTLSIFIPCFGKYKKKIIMKEWGVAREALNFALLHS